MGLLRAVSRCFGGCGIGGDSRAAEQRSLLNSWAPLPMDQGPQQQRRWWSRRSRSRAPAFGEGALREDEFSPQFTWSYQKRGPGYQYQYNPFLESVPEVPEETTFGSAGHQAAHAAPAAEGRHAEVTHKKAHAAQSGGRQRQQPQQSRAAAFGEGALQRWH